MLTILGGGEYTHYIDIIYNPALTLSSIEPGGEATGKMCALEVVARI